MSKKSWLISFIGVLAILTAAVIVLNRNVSNPEVATVPTLALLPSLTAQQDIQVNVSPTPLPQPSPVLVADSAVNLPATAPTIAPQAAPTELQPTTTVQSNPVVAIPSSVPVMAGVPPVIIPIPPAPIPNQIVIQFDPAASPQERAAYIQQIGGTVGQSIDALDTVVVKVPQSIAANPLPQSPLVKSSEPDYIMVALDSPATNDPFYSQQWALPVIQATNGWSVLPPNTPPITVAVIDSGICADQPDLFGRILPGHDYIDGDDNPQDEFGHGCGVAGIIAANPNNGIGIAGVAPNAMIMPLRVLDSLGNGSYSDVSAAIVYAVDHGAKIINLSVGGPVPDTVLEQAVDYAAAHNVLVVAAAGNTGGSVLYPAAYPSVIAVASVDPNLQLSSFSSRGPEVDLLAPGLNILTTNRNGSYTNMSGTSFAAPQVAGIAALELAVGHTLTLGGGIVAFDGGVTPTATPVVANTGDTINLNGWLMMTFGDPVTGSSDAPQTLIYLVNKHGDFMVNLSLDFETAHKFYGQQVVLTGVVAGPSAQASPVTLNVTAIQLALNTQSSDPSVAPLALTGSQPWVNIMCKFQDNPTETSTPAQIISMFTGLDDYWRKVSYNNINIAGTTTAPQWLTLPHPRSYYVDDNVVNYGANLNRLLQDCTAVANSSINFPSYVGINMMFNGWLDCCAWGGSQFVSIDGVTKIYRVTWLPYWAQRPDTIAHEMGHGFGFPHSSGPADKPPNGLNVYVSNWDIMSNAGGTCVVRNSNSYCLPQGTIAYHLDIDGWIPAARKTTVAYGAAASVNLQELSSTAAASGSLMVKIPIGGSATHFYT
ncbi:MAG: S8 family serine peptidase, partial [Chloroflexota bacterium]